MIDTLIMTFAYLTGAAVLLGTACVGCTCIQVACYITKRIKQ